MTVTVKQCPACIGTGGMKGSICLKCKGVGRYRVKGGVFMSIIDCRETLEMSPFWGELSEQAQTDLIRGLNLYYPNLFSYGLIGLEV